MHRSILKLIFYTSALFVVLWFALYFALHAIYPVKYSEYVCMYSDKYNIDSSLVYSVMKAESSFREDALSPKNAVGLMQITPETGAWIAENMNIDEYSLINTKINIMFSCWYLGYLTEKFGNTETAIAAYNAGEGNVIKWLSDSEISLDGKKLDNIPYSETNIYVKKVMNAYNIYNRIY